MLNLSEVFTYLVAWQDGQMDLRIILSSREGRFAFDCKLLRFSGEMGLSLQLSGENDTADLSLTGYQFDFLNEAEANRPHEECQAHPVYVRGLKCTRAPGEELVILEIPDDTEGRI